MCECLISYATSVLALLVGTRLLSLSRVVCVGVRTEYPHRALGKGVKVLVTGSRNWVDRQTITDALRAAGAEIVIHGDAQGADWIADAVAQSENMTRVRFPANWGRHGKAAGPIRNRFMFDTVRPDLVLAFPMKGSIGTWDMVKYAESKGCPVIVDERYL